MQTYKLHLAEQTFAYQKIKYLHESHNTNELSQVSCRTSSFMEGIRFGQSDQE